MIIPIVLACEFWEECYDARSRCSIAIIALLCILPFTWQAVRHVGKNILFDVAGYYDKRVESVNEIMDIIPQKDRNSVWAYDVNPSFYLYGNVIPCYKYFSLQSYMAPDNSAIDDEISWFIQNTPPQYIVIPSNSEIRNDDVRYAIKNDYQLMGTAEYGLGIALYKYKEN